MSKTTKALYVPLSIATSVSGGLLAGAVSNSSGAVSMTAPRTLRSQGPRQVDDGGPVGGGPARTDLRPGPCHRGPRRCTRLPRDH